MDKMKYHYKAGNNQSGQGGNRRADYEYRLFYNDENGVLQQMSLGKELNQAAIDKAKNTVNEVAKKKEEKNVQPAVTPEGN